MEGAQVWAPYSEKVSAYMSSSWIRGVLETLGREE